MAVNKHHVPLNSSGGSYKPLPDGTPVSWQYRSARGHGYIQGVDKHGNSAATTEYSIRQVDNHVGPTGHREAAVVHHYGSDVQRSSSAAVKSAAKAARAKKK